MNLRALFTNKWFLIGAAAAAGLGLYALIKRKGGGSGGGAGAQESPAYAAGGVGGFDSTGTDVAHWLGSQEQVLSGQFKEFQDSFFARLDAMPPGETGTGGITTISVPEGGHVEDVLKGYPGLGQEELVALNPGLEFALANVNGYVSATNPNTGNAIPVFGSAQQIKVPAKPS